MAGNGNRWPVRTVTTIRMPKDVAEELKQCAAAQNVTCTEIIVDAVKDKMAALKKDGSNGGDIFR